MQTSAFPGRTSARHPSYPQFDEAMSRLHNLLGDEADTTRFLQEVANRLANKYAPRDLQKSCVEPTARFLAMPRQEEVVS